MILSGKTIRDTASMNDLVTILDAAAGWPSGGGLRLRVRI
jgi:hypothetical protein